MTRTRTLARRLLSLSGVLLLALVVAAPHRVAADSPDTAFTAVRGNAASAVFTTGVAGGTISYSGYNTVFNESDATLKLCQVALNVAATVTETSATVTFDTCGSLRAIVNIYLKDNPAPFGNGQGFDSAPTTHHVVLLANLEPATAYLFHISDGMGNEIGDGSFVTNKPQIYNLRAQPGTTTATIQFDTDVPVATTVIIRGPGGELRTDLARSQHAYFQQTGLKPGTSYTYTILVHGLYLGQGQFKTGVQIDNGPALNPVSG